MKCGAVFCQPSFHTGYIKYQCYLNGLLDGILIQTNFESKITVDKREKDGKRVFDNVLQANLPGRSIPVCFILIKR